MSIRRLYRSRTDRIVAGIFGGLGQYFEVDSVLLRVVWLVLFVVTGFFPGFIIYVFAIFIIPLEPVEPLEPKVQTTTSTQTETETRAETEKKRA